ncbi:hypothetical protein U9M48_044359 [Paspalum notatum var. saurae]|uniref:Uncharacterized protein n=1 Tax=Paspalum notatum var. saurae TaxID=547442 RepID=A0AAQ3UYY4_PASNO
MEGRHAGKPLVALAVALSCILLLLPLAASVPVSRSRLRLGSQQQHPPALELTVSQEAAIAAAMNTGRPPRRPVARIAVEVNDYQPSGPNNRHDPPKGPGRA